MLIPVGVLSVLAAIGGFVEIPGVYTGFANWINPVAEPLVDPSVLQDYGTSLIAVIAAVLGRHGRLVGVQVRPRDRRPTGASARSSPTSSTSTSSTTPSSPGRPS